MYLVGFGASSMAGVGDSQGGFFRRAQDALAAKRPDLEFVNLGVGGHTTRDMLAHAEAVAPFSPHDLIVMLGCNDVPRANDTRPEARTTLGEYEQNLRALLPRIRGEFSLFISSFPTCAAKTGIADDVLTAYMEAATRVAMDSGFAIRDLYRELQGTDIIPYWADDGLHFNDTGHAMVADRFVTLMEHLSLR